VAAGIINLRQTVHLLQLAVELSNLKETNQIQAVPIKKGGVMSQDNLFSEFKLKQFRLKNRIGVAPMTRMSF